LIIYIILSINIFSIILSLRKWNNNTKIKHIGELKALVQANPILSFIFALTLFSIAGVPPLLGFYGKLYVFEALVKKASLMAENFALTETYNNINSLLVTDNLLSYENAGLIFHSYKYYIIIILALLMSVISALYYLRLIRIMFFNTETP
jgi:NADH:ubiquinone oxidoreductase subunit 2 (subunit N)